MPKTATISIRIDEDLKRRAQSALDDMGLPMSLAIELFLKQVADNGCLPFQFGKEGPTDEELAERAKRERQFWKSFITWYFQVWPMFDSPEMAKKAEADFGYTGLGAGEVAEQYIQREMSSLRDMSPEQFDAVFDLSNARHLLREAKELVYWALDMDRLFVPSIAAAYGDQLDDWRMSYLASEAKRHGDGSKPPAAKQA